MNPSVSGLKERLLVRQRFVAYLTAEMVRIRPHVSVRELMHPFEHAGDLYLQRCNRKPSLETGSSMQALGGMLANRINAHFEMMSSEPVQAVVTRWFDSMPLARNWETKPREVRSG